MRVALQNRAVPIFEFGSSTVVPLRIVEQVFDLAPLLADDDEVRHEPALFRSRFRDDGERKPLDEYVAEVDARAGGWLADIEDGAAGAPREDQRPDATQRLDAARITHDRSRD